MNVKVLQLEPWMTCVAGNLVEETYGPSAYDITCSGRYRPTPPVFNRPGIYRRGKECWFEREDGSAYTYDRSMFDYCLTLMQVESVNARQRAALAEIVAQGLATKAQRTLLHRCLDEQGARNTARSARIYVSRTLGRHTCQTNNL